MGGGAVRDAGPGAHRRGRRPPRLASAGHAVAATADQDSGSRIRKAVPSASLVSSTSPPCASAVSRTIARPRPLPFPDVFVVKNGSNTTRLQVGRDAGAGVRHLHDRIGDWGAPAASDVARVPANRGMRRQAQAAAVRHGVARVQAQVEDRLLDLRRVDVDRQRVGGAAHGELDARPGHRLRQLRARPDDVVDIHPLAGCRRRDGRRWPPDGRAPTRGPGRRRPPAPGRAPHPRRRASPPSARDRRGRPAACC